MDTIIGNDNKQKSVTLVFMAAGLGKRFGGNKQLAGLGPKGQSLMAYTAYDAVSIGYKRLLFILREEMVEEFMETLGYNLEKVVAVDIILQSRDQLPEGCTVPKEREKPLGTGHALYCAKERIEGPFVILNADDHYGRGVLKDLHEALLEGESMVIPGYPVGMTLSDKGAVSRGILQVDEKGHLLSIKEREKIWKEEGRILTLEGKDRVNLPEETLVSMNIWGLQKEMLEDLEEVFRRFLTEEGRNLLKDEFYLPEAMDALRRRTGRDLTIIEAKDAWMGITYAEDAEDVAQALGDMIGKGEYPQSLFGE